MNDLEIRAISKQLRPLADDIRMLFDLTGVHPEPGDHKVGFDHKRKMWTFGRLAFGNVRPRPGVGWVRRLGEPREDGIVPMEAVQRSWQNPARGSIEVVLDEEVSVEDGVERVKTDEKSWGSDWEVGGSVSTTVGTETSVSGSYMGVTAEAKVSASVTAEINAKKSGSKSGSKTDQDTRSKTTSSTRGVHQTFTIPGKTDFKATAIYDKTTLIVPYTDTLAVDVSFHSGFWNRANLDHYHRYYTDWWSGDEIKTPSLIGWISGFFGEPPSGCNDFRKGVDITFSNWSRETNIRNLLDEMRSLDGSMTIQRSGIVAYADAGAFRFVTQEREIE